MADNDWLAERFEEHRSHLRSVAYRMLGSQAEADDAIQEAWLRLHRTSAGSGSGSGEVDNLGGWLTTVVARISLDMLRSRKSRREEPYDSVVPEEHPATDAGPEQQTLLADSVGLALLVVLDTLPPAERLAYVLHDIFAVPFEEIAPIVDRSPTAARQLASRARRRVRGASPTRSAADVSRQRQVVEAFLAASRDGRFDELLAVLDPEVVVRADEAAVRMGAASEIHGAAAVARAFSGRAAHARPALVDGLAGAVWSPGGKPRVVFEFTVADGKVVALDLLADPEQLERLDLTPLG